MQPVVEEIISHGRKFNLGLECGSKPELHAVIAVQCQSDSIIVCNGYKDQSYIELALLAQKMGKRIFIVVEKMNEIGLIATAAKKLGVRPNIGIRIKLASSGSGKWQESGGDASKFGLRSSELLQALQILDEKRLARLRTTHPLPHRLADNKDTTHTDRTARGCQLLRAAAQVRLQHRLRRLRWRTRCRLRRHTLVELREFGELLYPGVRERLRVHASSTHRTRTRYRTRTSSPKADAHCRLTTRCSSSTCLRPLRCHRCARSLSLQTATTNS